jgi:hypothetical protein
MEINHWARLVAAKLVKKEVENPDSDLIILGHYGGWSTYKQDAWAGYGMKVQDLINSFIVVGPPGATGPQGPQGLTGPIGLQGSVGPVGPQGISGSQGPEGPEGPQGIQGDPGTSINPEGFVLDYNALLTMYGGTCQPTQPDPLTTIMLTGTTVNGTIYVFDPTSTVADGCGWVNLGQLAGVSGQSGPQGPVGPQGPQGPAGAAGTQGLVGPQGPAGSQGPIGVQGPIGNTGTSITGVTISTVTGYPTFFFSTGAPDTIETSLFGPQGTQGPQGVQGPIGLPGPAGPQGPAGTQGIQGIQGIQGANGNMWYNGLSIPTNAFGANGDYFIINATGEIYKKISGAWQYQFTISGPQGVQGPQGDPGDEGPQGPPGTNGANGANAASGVVGFVTKVTDYTITGANKGYVILMNNAADAILTIADLTSIDFPEGYQIVVVKQGAGKVTIQAGTNVTVNSANNMKVLRAVNSAATVIKQTTRVINPPANSIWWMFGDLTNVV